MAAGINAGNRDPRRRAASGEKGRRGALAPWVLCGLLLVACAGGTSRPEPAPLMTATLLLKPLDQGRLSSGYGVRYHPILKRRQTHRGIDWAAPRGTPVRAAGNGVVVAAGRFGAYGEYLRIDHGGAIATAYAHLEAYAPGLRPGGAVHQGEMIGRVGSTGRATGPHLHYEVLVAGRQIDPLAFAPTVVARAPALPRVTAAGFGNEIGGADIAAPSAGDLDRSAGRSLRSLPLDVIDGSALIRVEDLLGRYGS
ncbi:MAG: M23 family metallopeptidase [Geminicoccaceae bacterium]